MSKFQEMKFEQVTGKAGISDNSGPSSARPLVAFKFHKNIPKVPSNERSAVVQAFFDSESNLVTNRNPEYSKPLLTTKFTKFDSTRVDAERDQQQDKNQRFLYTEPSWGGRSTTDIFKLELLKSGVIVDCFDLSTKSFYIIGKSCTCDIALSHQTISQHHAVLQCRSENDSSNKKGLYIFDLNSKSGTFVNGSCVTQNEYVFLNDGDILSFGGDDGKYILQAKKRNNEVVTDPLEKEGKEESQMVESTERQSNLPKGKEAESSKEVFTGINWGIPDDIDENSTSTIGSDSNADNDDAEDENLYLNDPKKALKNWFDWEGYELEYETEDIGFGRHSCCINLTLDPTGSTKRIKVDVTGDIMKAIDECAMKACQFLFTYGFLQQAQEEKKSTLREWEKVDYYESDDDNFLDRTGTVEKKRIKRIEMSGKTCENESMMKEYSDTVDQIKKFEHLLAMQTDDCEKASDSDGDDALDVFMSKLNSSSLNKIDIKDIKIKLRSLYKKKTQMLKFVNLNEQVADREILESQIFPGPITEKTKNGCRFK